jgi:hypothetical protein
MVLTATTDSLDIVLGAAVTTNQLPITVYYDDVTSSAVTPTKRTTQTNSTTAVNVIPAPSAGHSFLLKYCSIYNNDTVPASVTIQFNDNSTNRKEITTLLQVGESIQWTVANGWKAYDAQGSMKVTGLYQAPNAVNMPAFFAASNASTTLSLTSTNCYCVYLGRVERNFSNINVAYRITTAAATITWCELAIYKGTPTLGSNATLTRLGYTDTSGSWQSTGQKNTAVSVAGNLAAGDDIWAVFSNSATTVAVVRAGLADDINGGFFQTVTNKRPSTNSSLSGTIDSSTSMIWCSWQGS